MIVLALCTSGLTVTFRSIAPIASPASGPPIGGGTMGVEATVTAVPSPPQHLQATGGDGMVTLNWDPPADDGGLPVLLYRIYRGTTSGGESFLIEVPLVLTYIDLTVTNGVTYYYTVTAVNLDGESGFSNEASATPGPPPPPPTVPGPPKDLVAAGGDGSVTLTWSAPEDDGGAPITNYHIYRGTSSGGESLYKTVDNVLSDTDTGVTNGVTYYYEVTAENSEGEGPRSNEAAATPAGVPGAPQNLQATAGDGSVDLAWSSPGSDGGSPINEYRIYRGTSPDGELFLTSVPGEVHSYLDTGVTNGNTYYYKATAVNDAGEGSFSNEVVATPMSGDTVPGPPRSLMAVAGDGRVMLSWQAPSSDGGTPITDYRVYRGVSSGGESWLATVSGDVLSYTDAAVTNGNTYYYYVTAVNAVGEGAPSNEVSATPEAPPSPPGPPLDLRATAGDGTVLLEWSAPTDDGGSPVTNYKVYRGTISGQLSLLATIPDVTSYADSSVTNGQKYYYQVSAVNDAGEGPRSNEASATPRSGDTVPDPPRDLTGVGGDNRVALAWQVPASDGGTPITNYNVYRGASSGGESWLATVSGDVLSYTDTAVTNGTTYYYYVTAVNAIGESAPSNEVSATPSAAPTVPDAPRDLKAAPGDASVTLTWSPPDSNGSKPITNYKVYRGTNSGDRSHVITVGNVESYTDGGLNNGQRYYYVVTAVNEIGEGPASNEASAIPATVPGAPVDLRAAAGDGTVTLQWSGPPFNGGAPVTNYRIYRGTTSGSTSLLATIGAVDSYGDTGLANGETYFYQVTAMNRVGEGPPSAETSVAPTAGPTVPGAPQSLVATSGDQVVTLTWSAPATDGGSPVRNYTIYRGLAADRLTILARGAASLSLWDAGLTNGVTYFYEVAALTDIGEGPRSGLASATPHGTSIGPDTVKPVIAITNPIAGATVPPGPTLASGTASDDTGVVRVDVSSDGVNWIEAWGTAAWTASLNFTAGNATLYARATDAAGNSAIASLNLTVGNPPTPIAAGEGLPRSLLLTASLSFAIAAVGAWFLLKWRQRKGQISRGAGKTFRRP